MSFEPLTEEQYNKAVESGFTHDQIISFEKQRQSDDNTKSKNNKPTVENQNIIGRTFNVPGATSRAAIQSNPALAATGPLAGLLAISGISGKQSQQAASQGALNPSSVPTFQNQALDSYYKKVGSGPLQTAGGFLVSAGGLAADMATDPTSVLMNLLPGLLPGKVQTMSSAIDKPFLKAINPGTKGIRKYSDIETLKNNARSAVQSIVDNKENLQLSDITGAVTKGRLPENLDEFSQSISQTKKQIFNKYDSILKDAGEKGATVPLRPIADEILKAVSHPHIEDLSPTVQNYGLQLADRLQKRGTYTLTEAQDTIEALNNKLKTYFSNPTPEGLHQAVIDRAVVNNLKNSLVATVESNTGVGYDILRRQYGKLNAIEENVTKAALKNSGSNSSGLVKMFDTLSSGDIVNGVLSMNPAIVAKGGFQVAARKIFSSLNNPNNIVKNMFSNVDRIKNIEPQKVQLMNLLNKASQGAILNTPARITQSGSGETIDKISSTDSEASTVKGYDDIKNDEGFKGNIYRDTVGIPTIGYGFNVNEPSIRKMIPKDVLSGQRKLTREEADPIFDKAYDVAYKDASKYIGYNNFNKLSNSQQDVLINMSYALGSNRLNGFKRLKQSLIQGDYDQASKEIINSKWAKQVKGRASRLAQEIKN